MPRAHHPSTVLVRSIVLLSVLALAACGAEGAAAGNEAEGPAGASAGEPVEPPFPVRGELEGLMLTWIDAEGTHLAERRSEVPEAARAEVRVDSPMLAPEDRDPESVFVADLRAPAQDGSFAVRRMPRTAFEERARAARQPVAGEPSAAGAAGGEIIVFGASWCGACRQAEAYLRQRGVAFVERDIEQDPAARQDMMRRARAAGISANGIPIIDIRGRVMQGFDAGAIDRALRETGGTGAPPTGAAPSGAAPSGGVTI